MEEQTEPSDLPKDVLEEGEAKPEPDPFEQIREQFKKYDEEMETLKKYIKTLGEEVNMLKSNFKLLTEELK